MVLVQSNHYRLLLLEVLSGTSTDKQWEPKLRELPFIPVIGSKSFYDAQRILVQLHSLATRELLFKHQGKVTRWIDTRAMLADSLTKDCVPMHLRHIMTKGEWGVALQLKALECQNAMGRRGKPPDHRWGLILVHHDRLRLEPLTAHPICNPYSVMGPPLP